MAVAIIITVPALLAIVPFVCRRARLTGVISAAGHGVVLAGLAFLVNGFLAGRCEPLRMWGWVYIDSLSVFFLAIAAVVNFAAAVYSVGYICSETEEGVIPPRKAGAYYHLLNLFALAMLAIPLLGNVALVWIAIEMTTLISAFLVGFHNVKESIEAAWKYIIICSVGITFALLGIIFFYYTSSNDAHIRSLEWQGMLAGSGMFDAKVVRIALVFIFVGYGTKAGLAPMHNWLPDAHSQALSPVSGLLSGALLKISIYAILRFVMLANLSAGYAYSARLFVLFGMASLAVAGFFILVQKDLKRLLAYSSVENIGLVSLGLGFGPCGGIAAGLLQAFNHAVTKALMFFCAGNAVRAYRGNNMNAMQGILKTMPFTGSAMFLGLFALCGMPPFSIFISKLCILMSAFRGGHYIAGSAMLVFIALAFAGLVFHISGIVLGSAPAGMPRQGERLSSKAAIVFLGLFVVGLGLVIPRGFMEIIINCQDLVLGR